MKQKSARRSGASAIWGCLLMLLLVSPAAYGQSRRVTGTVSDANGPLAGAIISIVTPGGGGTGGAITDGEGRYALSATTGQTLRFTYFGYLDAEVPLTTQSVVDVTLEEDVTGLDEVIAIGYGVMRKRDLTGAVSSVKAEDVTLSPAINPLVNIQGKVPGLDITQASGQPGSEIKIQLRGNRSISADSNPLFLIDGMPGDFATLNPNDIASVEVLKDASSTAVYGARGANGVIIVTTKRPQTGAMVIDFNAYYGFNGWSILPEMRGDGPQYIDALRDANKAVGRWSSPEDDRNIFATSDDYDLYMDGQFLDWNKRLMQTAAMQNYSLSISGGNEKTKGYLSLNYSNEAGQYDADDYKLYSSVMRVEHQLKDWVKIGANATGSYVDRSKAYANLNNAMRMYPLGRIYNEDNSLNPQPVGTSRVYNLLLNSQKGVYDDLENNFRLNFNPYVEFAPIAGLTFLSRANVALTYNKSKYFQGFNSYQWHEGGRTDANVFAELDWSNRSELVWENILTYNRDFNGHNFTLTGATTYSHYQREDAGLKYTNIKDNVNKWNNMDSSATTSTADSDYTMNKTMGLIGRVNYSYEGKYLASASVRYDGSSKLYKDKRWSTFPAFSAGWTISQENFMKSTRNWLDNLKLRASWGITGTDNVAAYSSMQALESGFQLVGGQALDIWKYSQFVTNPALTWEESTTIDLGLDAMLFGGRVDLSLDWYNTKTDGVLWSRDLNVTGWGHYAVNSPYKMNMNIASTKNTGWELALNTINVDRTVRWTSTVTFSANKEEITKLDGVSTELDTRNSTGFYLKVGEPVNSYKRLKVVGIWQTDEAADAAVFTGGEGLSEPGTPKIDVPGLFKESDGKFYTVGADGIKTYYDKDNKYNIDGKADQIIGHESPDWSLGFQNTVTYKGFDLSIYAFARVGQMIQYEMLGSFDPSGKENYPTYFDYWTVDNPSNMFPAANADRARSDYLGFGDMSYVDGSFFKIKNITLGYTLPQTLLQKAGISRLRVYGTITNPVVVARSKYIKQYDPEMAGELNYPLTKQLVFGVNLTF